MGGCGWVCVWWVGWGVGRGIRIDKSASYLHKFTTTIINNNLNLISIFLVNIICAWCAMPMYKKIALCYPIGQLLGKMVVLKIGDIDLCIHTKSDFL